MQAVAQDELRTRGKEDFNTEDGLSRVTRYFGDSRHEDDNPNAFLVEFRPVPGGAIRPHFHKVAQFQVVIGGDGHLGKSPVTPIAFHYADASTPYGPIKPSDEERGIDFLTLRSVTRKGIWWMPGARDEIAPRAGREHRNVVSSVPDGSLPETGSTTQTLIEEHPDRLAAFLLRLAADESAPTPSPEGTGGQYLLVTRGALTGPSELGPLSLLFAHADEEPTLTAGPEGAEVLVLQFPTKVLP
jgi:hypothetical protein